MDIKRKPKVNLVSHILLPRQNYAEVECLFSRGNFKETRCALLVYKYYIHLLVHFGVLRICLRGCVVARYTRGTRHLTVKAVVDI